MSYKRVSIGLMTLLTAILCFFAILLSTPWGAQLTFFIVNGVSPIQTEYKSGALLKDLTLKQLTINNDNLVIKAKDINLQLHLRCLWKSQLCIDELSIAALYVNMKDGQLVVPETLEEQPINFSNITLPFNIKMKKFTLAKAQIKSKGVEVKLTGFSSALSVSKNVLNTIAINIEKSTLASAHLNLLMADDSAKTPTATTGNPSIDPSTWALATLPTLYSPFKLAIKSFDVKKVTVNEVKKTGDKNSLLSIDNAVVRLSWFKTQLSIEQLSSKVNTVGELSFKGKVDFIPPYEVDLTFNSVIEEFDLLPQLNHSTQQVLLHGNLSQLETNLSSEGELAFTADMSINVTDANLPYSLSADISQFILPNEITEFITPSTLLFKSQGDINSHVVELKSKVTGYGYHDATLELNAMYSEQIFKLKTLHFEELNSNNNLTMTGELALGDRLLWDVNVNSSGITLPNIDKRLSGRVQGNVNSKGFWQDKEWAFSVLNSTLTGEVNNIKLNAKANVDINHKGQLTPSELKVDYGDIALHLKGYSNQNWHVEGMAHINSTSLWLKDFESNLSTKIAINGPILQPEINLQGEIKKLLMANLFSDSISFDAKYQPLNNHQHQINLVSPLINMGEHSINNVSLASFGDLNQQKTSLAWQGDSSLNLLLNSQYSPEKSQWKVETQQPTFAIEDHVFTSNQPIALVYHEADKKLAINKHCWQEANSQLCIKEDITVSPDQGELALTIKLNTELIKPFIPSNLHLDNSFEGDIVISWQPDMSPSVDAKLLISAGDIKIDDEDNQQKIVEWQSGLLNLKIIKDSVNGSIALFSHNIIKDTVDSRSEVITINTANRATKTTKEATDNLAEILSAKFSVLLANNRIVDSHIRLNDYSLSPLKSLFPELTLLKGTINTQLTLNGQLDKPAINGKVILSNGETKILGDINTLDNINMTLDFKGNQAEISGGLNINQATATLSGEADWQNELQGNFNLDGELITFSIPPDLTLTVSPHLNAQIQASALKLSGRIEVLDGKLLVNKPPQDSVSLSKDVMIVNDKGEQVVKEKRFDVLTNVRILIADAVKIEGQGFVGRIGGELQVSQQPQQPLQLFGSLKIPEGRYRAYGQDLSITKSNISFNGAVNNPYVSLQATRSIDKEDIIVGIEATGLANSLNIKLFSKPNMQQSETLSYLVRGRGLDAETNDSNTAIGVVLGTTITNFSGVLTQIEKLPLINRIEIDGDDKHASIAGYLGDQVYIKYGVGVLEPINELTVRFYLLSRLWVEAVSGLENSANIYYSFDIE